MDQKIKTTDTLLIVDQDISILARLADFFEDNGFEVLQAINGSIALELLHKNKPDLVLTDINILTPNGVSLLETIVKESPQTPIIVASEPSSMNDVIQVLRHGAWDYVAKPYTSFQVVEHVVAKTLERSRLLEENKRYREQLEITNQALKKSLDILREDQEAGRIVQMRMLPEQNVEFGSYQFSHGISPSLYLSGDFVDYFKINESCVGFYLADVSGHGASSAFVTVLLKSLIHLALTKYQLHDDQLILEPDKLLSLLSTEIYNAKLGKYLTIIYGVLDFSKDELSYSIGGHYPNPIWIENNEPHFLEGKGFPIGIMKQSSYQKHNLHLPKGIHLAMFSDGIMEIIEEPDLPAKEKHLLSIVAAGDATIDIMKQNFKLTEERALPDDVTMLILKRK